MGPSKNAYRILGSLLFSIASGALLLLRIDYRFEKSDQLQYLLLPYREIYRDFLVGDWMTWQTAHYHVAYSWLIQAIHGIAGEALFPWGVFFVHALALAGTGYGMLRLARAAGWSWLAAAVGVLVIGFVRQKGIAGAVVNHGQLLPADFALVFLLIGCAAWIEDRYLRAGLCLGLSGLIHLNFAILAPLLLAAPELYRIVRTRRFREPLLLAGGYLLLAWPTLLVTILDLLRVDPAPGALEIVFKIRSPHHYNPPLESSLDPWWPAALLLAGLPVWIGRGAERMNGKALALCAALVGSQILAGLATVFGWSFFIRIFLWRLSIPLILFAAMAFGENLVRSVASRRVFRLLFAAMGLAVVLSFSADGVVRFRPTPGIDWRKAADRWKRFSDVKRWKIESETRAVPIYWWIRNHTPKGAVFLIPPGESQFRLLARRAVFVDSKACPMIGAEVLEWQRRMLALIGARQLPRTGDFQELTHQADRLYGRRSLQELAALAKQERITHILAADRKGAAEAGLRKLYSKGGQAVYQVLNIPRILGKSGKDAPYLPDYSYAGYRYGEAPLPDPPETISVADFGAVPDDEGDDTDAILKALEKAHDTRGPVVLGFPKGRFILRKILYIERSDLVLRGAGSGPDGTVLSMPEPLKSLPRPEALEELEQYIVREGKYIERGGGARDPFSLYAWAGGYIWTRMPGVRVKSYLSEYDKPLPVLARISSGRRGEQAFEVDSAGKLEVGAWIRIAWFNRQGKRSSLIRHLYADRKLPKIGERHWDAPNRPLITQETTITAIDGNRVSIKDTLLDDLRPEWQPVVAPWPHLSEVGIQGFHFAFPERPYAGHHFEDGYNAVYLTGLADSWVRDISVEHGDSGLLAEECANVTIEGVRVSGRLRHYSVELGSVHNVIARKIVSEGPALHALSFNTGARRSVFSDVRLLDAPDLDMHAGANQQNLFEQIEARVARPGESIWKPTGPGYWKPTHGPFTTFWNIRIDFAFPNPSGKKVALSGIKDGPDARLVGIYANYPIAIDYGPFAYLECIGEGPISIPSLYAYQRKKRLSAGR